MIKKFKNALGMSPDEWRCERKIVMRKEHHTDKPYKDLHVSFKRPKASKAAYYPLWLFREADLFMSPHASLETFANIVRAFGGNCDENGQLTPPWICSIESISAVLSSCNVLNSVLNSLVATYAAPLCHALTVNVTNLDSSTLALDMQINGTKLMNLEVPYTHSTNTNYDGVQMGVFKLQFELCFGIEPGIVNYTRNGTVVSDMDMLCKRVFCDLGLGRPFLLFDEDKGRDEALKAKVVQGEGWCKSEEEKSQLPEVQRARLAELWAADGLAEHSSIATFARFTLQLMVLGAPSDLLSRSQQAGKDEVEHARLCFQLAHHFGGQHVAPSGFPLPPALDLVLCPAQVARSVILEGCVGETACLLEIVEREAHCKDPPTCEALQAMIKDETEHAVLAWKTVQWLMKRYGHIREVVEATFLEAIASASCFQCLDKEEEEWLYAYGRLPEVQAARHRDIAVTQFVSPLAMMLLGEPLRTTSLGWRAQQLFDILETQLFTPVIHM